MFAAIVTLFAQETAPVTEKAAQQPPGMQGALFPFVVVGIAMLCFFILPARRQQKELKTMMATLKPGAKIATAAGIIGTIVTIKDGDDEVVIRSADSKLKISRASITRVLAAEETDTK